MRHTADGVTIMTLMDSSLHLHNGGFYFRLHLLVRHIFNLAQTILVALFKCKQIALSINNVITVRK